jgi:hypothetical protein
MLLIAFAAALLVACGGNDDASSAATETATESSSTASATATDGGDSGGETQTATVTVNGEMLSFEAQQCLGAADNFAFIGFTAEGNDSFEIQATTNAAQQDVRLTVGDASHFGGEITRIEVGDWHATGSAEFPDDGTEIDFDVSCG